MKKYYCVYIITNKRNGTLYIGCTSDLSRRIFEHKNDIFDGFSTRYKLKLLVYYELYEGPEIMIKREKQLKDYDRSWKIDLIEKVNPQWEDLYFKLSSEL